MQLLSDAAQNQNTIWGFGFIAASLYSFISVLRLIYFTSKSMESEMQAFCGRLVTPATERACLP